jgi:hypothetical protein
MKQSCCLFRISAPWRLGASLFVLHTFASHGKTAPGSRAPPAWDATCVVATKQESQCRQIGPLCGAFA